MLLTAPERAALRLRALSVRHQLGALAREDPFTASLALVALAAVAVWLARMAMGGPRAATAAAALVALPAWATHATRADARFLAGSGARPARVMTAEYVALAAPGTLLVVAAALASRTPLAACCGALSLAIATLVARTPPGGLRRVRRTSSRAHGRDARPDRLGARFELRRGLRTEGVVLALVLLAGLALATFPLVPAIAMLLVAVSVASWYAAVDEDWPLVVALGRTPDAFLRAKLASALGAWTLASAPLAVVGVVRTPEAWIAPALAVLAGVAVVSGGVLLKYARYAPGRRAPAIALLGSLTIAASLLVPPLAVWLLATWRRAAVRAITPYIGADALGAST